LPTPTASAQAIQTSQTSRIAVSIVERKRFARDSIARQRIWRASPDW